MIFFCLSYNFTLIINLENSYVFERSFLFNIFLQNNMRACCTPQQSCLACLLKVETKITVVSSSSSKTAVWSLHVKSETGFVWGRDRPTFLFRTELLIWGNNHCRKGVSSDKIKTLGRWESSAYLLYVRLSREELSSISALISTN